MEHNATELSPEAWDRARSVAMNSPAVALTLAMNDPDGFHREEAVNLVMTTPMESFTEADRVRLVTRLAEVPGAARQKALAESLASYANMYADDEEKSRLRKRFTEITIAPDVREIGERIGTRADLDRAERQRRRGLFSRT